MYHFILIILFPYINGYCEEEWITNSNTSRTGITEISNAISSLSYTTFGLVGLLQNNHSSVYYLIMNLFIFTGIASFLHHYYISIGTWTHLSDVICMQLLAMFSLFYITCDNEYKLPICKRFLNLITTFTGLTLLTLLAIGYGERTVVLQITISEIVITQLILCSYLIYIKSQFKRCVIFTSIWNGLLFSFGIIMFYIDIECPTWMYDSHFNGHAIWHIAVSWALFNTISITNLCRYSYNNIEIIWKPLCKYIPGFIYLVIITHEKSNITNSYTAIDISEVRLLMENNNNTKHRRIRSYG